MKQIELLAPARDLSAAVAAVDHGADALYIGGARFGARHAAGNSTEQIARAVEYARPYGVRVYATLNILLYNDDLKAAEAQARELLEAGVDALIVQDMAFRRMDLPAELHASTQMATHTPAQALFLERCGFSRVILERALSLDDIRAIRATTSVELECFVHGAICVGYSGRCFLSRSMSERSGNRGACSQPCRLHYDLKDGAGHTLAKGRHLLSVRDMNLSERIGDLIDAGITSLKIEGRLKDDGYIKNVVAHYRRAIDRALADRAGFVRSSVGESTPGFTPDPAKSFTRGFSEYFLDGRRAGVASFDTPKAIGEPVRREELHPADGVCYFNADGRLVGTHANKLQAPAGTPLFRNYDHRFTRALEGSRTRRVIPVTAEAVVTPDTVAIRFVDGEGIGVQVEGKGVFEPAKEPEKMAATLREQLSRGGDTIFDVRKVRCEGTDRFVPVSILARLRREGLSALLVARMNRRTAPKIGVEDRTVPCPSDTVSPQENVTNRLAEQFYRDHGVRHIARGLDLEPTTAGQVVMRSVYCLRREIGECLKERPRHEGDLFLVHGAHRYRLEFDCKKCEMSLRHV